MADPRPAGGSHATHDLELIARVAAGDGSEVETREARALLSTCADCSDLDADLRAIVESVRSLGSAEVVARAPRDFRLTPADATRLRRTDGLGVVRAGLWAMFGSVRGQVGGGLVAIGVIGILLGGGIAAQPQGFDAARPAPTAENSDAKRPVTGAVGIAPAATDGGTLLNGAASTTTPTPLAASTPAPSGPTSTTVRVLVASGLLVVAGLALLLSAARGRRAGP